MKCRHDETDNDNHQSYSSDRVKLKSSGAYYLGVSAKSPPPFLTKARRRRNFFEPVLNQFEFMMEN